VATDSETVAPPPAKAAERRLPWLAMVLVALGIVVAGGGLGALGGWLWYRWWAPANTGEIYDTTSGPRWYDLSDHGFTHQFDGPAQYAVVALGLGAVLGVLAAVVGRRQALLALGALVVGSALAAYLSWLIGTEMSPPDPQALATKANIGNEYPAAIELSGWTPFLCWGIGALGMFALASWAASWLRTARRIFDEVQPLPSATADRPEQSSQP
jgi:hypothetical protein